MRTMIATVSTPPRPPSGRFDSLDMFRGLTVFMMIVVNSAEVGPLRHADWFGFTIADLVFPSFLFAVGNAMAFAFRREMTDAVFLKRVVRRGALIFLLGVLLYWYPFVMPHPDGGWTAKPFAETRLTGVLQRIALCYMAAAVAVRFLTPRGLLWLSAVLLLGYWAVLVAFGPVGAAFSREGNVGNLVDLTLIGRDHLYVWDHGFDPEGVLGTFPAIVNVIAGYLVGRFLQRHGRDRAMVARLAAVGAALVVAVLLWSPFFPIAKKLWTGSFVLLTVGLDMLLLAGFVAWVEIGGHAHGRRFLGVFGRNPLAIYLFSELFIVTLNLIPIGGPAGFYAWIGTTVFQAIAPGPAGIVLRAVAYALLCWAVGWWLDRRGVILKV